MSAKGEINLAPYSFFNGVSTDLPIVMFSSEGRKDSLSCVEETGEFVCSLAGTWMYRLGRLTTDGWRVEGQGS
jgi:flavin reductase (DIM6/NTAB) family NADH-FMN oxidoreductase RutF